MPQSGATAPAPPLAMPRSLARSAAVCALLSLLAFAACVPSATAAPAPWQDLFVLDCGGVARAFPSHPIMATQINATLLTR